jgi:hypothetical protein
MSILEDGDFEFPIKTEAYHDEKINRSRVSEALRTPCTQIKTSNSHTELLQENIQSSKLDNELRQLEIASKKIESIERISGVNTSTSSTRNY